MLRGRRYSAIFLLSVLLVLSLFALPEISSGEVIGDTIKTDLVPSPVNYWVLLPDDYETSKIAYPLLLLLHGYGGYSNELQLVEPVIRDHWSKGQIPKMVIVTPDCDNSYYLDFYDGSQKWETFIITTLLPHIQKKYRVSLDKDKTFIGGISMGGIGCLRLGLKYPDKFGAIVAWEPAIEPATSWKDVKFPTNKPLLEKLYGTPINEAYWESNNPASIALKNSDVIRKSGIKIYIEVGTKDQRGFFRGTDFLHRILFDHNIPHEYRLVYGADHVGPTLIPRMIDGLSFLDRILKMLSN